MSHERRALKRDRYPEIPEIRQGTTPVQLNPDNQMHVRYHYNNPTTLRCTTLDIQGSGGLRVEGMTTLADVELRGP